MTIIAVRIATTVYALLITGVVVSAGNGWYREIFAWVHKGATDKWMHFLLVGCLSLLINLSLRCKVMTVSKFSIQFGTLFLLVLTTLEEFSQNFIARRDFDWFDLLCNLAGVITFGLIAWYVGRLLGLRSAPALVGSESVEPDFSN